LNKTLTAGIISLLSYFPVHSQPLSSNFVENSPIYNKISMSILEECFDTARRFNYVNDSFDNKKGYDYWQNSLETQTTLSGDCEDKAIYLQERLKNYQIHSELVDGKYDSTDISNHLWLEINSNDTTYLIDATNTQIFYKTSPGIEGNVPKNKYIENKFRGYIKFKAKEYYERNNVRLIFKNKKY
jgi:hypothetical protein